jgi:cytochrome c oxidase subunit 2
MRLLMVVDEPEDYEAWYNSQESWLSQNPTYLSKVPEELHKVAEVPAGIKVKN